MGDDDADESDQPAHRDRCRCPSVAAPPRPSGLCRLDPDAVGFLISHTPSRPSDAVERRPMALTIMQGRISVTSPQPTVPRAPMIQAKTSRNVSVLLAG